MTEAEISEAESAARGYFIAAHEELALEFESHRSASLSRFHGLEEISDGDEVKRKALESVRDALDVRLKGLSDSIMFRRSKGLAAFLNPSRLSQMRAQRQHLATLVARLRRSEESSISSGRLQVSKSTRLAITSFWIASVMGLAGVTGFFILVSRLLQAEQKMKAVEASKAQELEHRVHERTAELTEAIGDLEAFSYSVSHDLRTPLRAISGYASVVEENLDGPARSENHDLLQRVRSNCLRMSELMDALMSLARLSRTELELAEINMSSLVAEIVTESLAEEPQRNIRISIEPGLTATGDAAMIRILLTNLIGNAAKFTGKVEQAFIEFGNLETESGGFFVRDNGDGFDQEFAGSIFKPFERLHREAEFKGTGIGLATCAKIVRRHAGKIWIESVKHSGTTVFFVLPVSHQTVNGSLEQEVSTPQIPSSAR